MANVLKRRIYAKDTMLVREGQEADTVFFLQSGQLKVIKNAGAEDERCVTHAAQCCLLVYASPAASATCSLPPLIADRWSPVVSIACLLALQGAQCRGRRHLLR